MRVLFQLRSYTDFFPLLMTKHSTIQHNNWNSWREIHTRTFLPTGKLVLTLWFCLGLPNELICSSFLFVLSLIVQRKKYSKENTTAECTCKHPSGKNPWREYHSIHALDRSRSTTKCNHTGDSRSRNNTIWSVNDQKVQFSLEKIMTWVTPTKFMNNTPTKF